VAVEKDHPGPLVDALKNSTLRCVLLTFTQGETHPTTEEGGRRRRKEEEIMYKPILV
jgi:hypothetical protein